MGATGPQGIQGASGATGSISGYINGPISGFSLLIGATSAGVISGATGQGWFGGAVYVGPQGATGIAFGATGSVTASATVQGSSFKTSNWTVTGASGATGALYFSINGVNKAKLDVDGNFSVTGDIIAYETIT